MVFSLYAPHTYARDAHRVVHIYSHNNIINSNREIENIEIIKVFRFLLSGPHTEHTTHTHTIKNYISEKNFCYTHIIWQ